MRFSIIIPHWNGIHHLDDCLNSLRAQSFKDFEILLVDNGSSDGSQAYVTNSFPEVNLIELNENRGFTGACIAGYERSAGEIIILLNNDTETTPDWLETLHTSFEQFSNAGSIIGKILLFDQRDTFHTAGDTYSLDGLPGNRGVWQKDEGQYDQTEPIFSGCGAAVAYRKSALDEVGFLDPDFFFSCEDVDLGFRLNLAGWPVIYEPNARIYHKVKASGGSGATASFHDGRNFIWLLVKNYPSTLFRKHWRSIARAQLKITAEALRAWRGEAARARIRGQLSGLLTIPKMWPKRKAIQQSRRLTDDALTQLLCPVDEP